MLESERALGVGRIGGIAFKPSDIVEPGRIRLADQATDRLAIGELDNRVTPRLKAMRTQATLPWNGPSTSSWSFFGFTR